MPTVTVEDTELYYECTGRGPTLLFIHGMCGDADVWAHQADRLGASATCVRYDRRGHSRSTRGQAPISVARHADDAAGLIEQLGLVPCLVVASSGGAVIAMDLMLRHAPLLRGVVLSEPPAVSIDPDAGAALMNDIKSKVEPAMAAGGPGAAVDAFFELVCPGLWAIAPEAAKARYRANGEIGFTDVRSPGLAATTADLAAVQLPVLVIAGDRSHPALRSIARQVAGALSDVRLVELADCGHVTYAEQPEAFTHAVTTFAAELAPRPVPTPR